jgi:hypothetical protein
MSSTYVYPVPNAPAAPSATGTNSGLIGGITSPTTALPINQLPLPPTNINYQP